jgi:GNAT superfamily N-acetyltransferase
VALWIDLVQHHRRLDPDYPTTPGIRAALGRELDRGLKGAACRVYVAETGTELAGFVFAEVEAGGTGWIHELFVVEDERRQGLARRLVDRALLFLGERDASRHSVRVERLNEGGARFWEALGFLPRATIFEKP